MKKKKWRIFDKQKEKWLIQSVKEWINQSIDQ